MTKYLVTYPNGKQCELTRASDLKKSIWGTESKFSTGSIGWRTLEKALNDLKESGAIVKKIIK